MFSSLKDKIISALSSVMVGEKDIVSLGIMNGLSISKNKDVFFVLNVDPDMGSAIEDLRQASERAVKAIKGIGRVDIVMTSERKAVSVGKHDPHGMDKNPSLILPIRHIIAVASEGGRWKIHGCL
jgi:metal-sulfur cluster biosynthetic enzyme